MERKVETRDLYRIGCVILFVCAAVVSLVFCRNRSEEKIMNQFSITFDSESGSVCVGEETDDFNSSGFKYGDSLDFYFSNGVTLKDVPYFSGFYVKTGSYILCANSGCKSPLLTIGNSGDLWKKFNLEDDDNVVVSLNSRGKYLKIEESMKLISSDKREDFNSDAAFANFRAMNVGKMKQNLFFRSSSPCNDRYNRAAFADNLMKENKINFVLDMADSDEKIQSYQKKDDFNSPYFYELYEAGKVSAFSMNMDFNSEEFQKKLAEGLRQLCKNEGPYLICCTEGRDITGFAAVVIEALCGASYDELREDYMKTYGNFYGITEESEPEKYAVITDIKFDELICCLSRTRTVERAKKTDLSRQAENYLRQCGMTSEEVYALKAMLIN